VGGVHRWKRLYATGLAAGDVAAKAAILAQAGLLPYTRDFQVNGDAKGVARSKISRRRIWKRKARGAVAAAIGVISLDGRWIESHTIETTRWTIATRLDPVLKIAQVSDLHVVRFRQREREAVRILEEERPDAVLVTGDSVGDGFHYDQAHAVLSAIAATRPPLGAWVVNGNWETMDPVENEHEFYQTTGLRFLPNRGVLLRPGVWLAGLDDPSTGEPDLGRALQGAPADAYVIAMFHSPAYFAGTSGRYDLALAGHTHGGQVNLGIRPFWLPRGSGRFLKGWYEERGSRMYVSRGVGWSHVPIRVNCAPEIPIFTIGG
jgi:predicted MPP superfamily phosphohydrolase